MTDRSTTRTSIQWTRTAKEALAKLPRPVRKGLLEKADLLLECDDPRTAHKPLTGPLLGYYRITHGRYRAIYTVEEHRVANGDVLRNVRVMFVAAGIRKGRSREDIYRVAQKMIELGFAEFGEQ